MSKRIGDFPVKPPRRESNVAIERAARRAAVRSANEVCSRVEAENKRLLAALKRADEIIGWMASYLGRMAPPSNGIAELNEHWLDMPKLLKGWKEHADWRGPRAEDERPIDQRPAQ